MKKIIGGKLYDTETSECLATNEFADRSNRLQNGRGVSLYRTAKGNFFALNETCWQGERDTVKPLTIAEAKELFEELHGDAEVYMATFGAPEEA